LAEARAKNYAKRIGFLKIVIVLFGDGMN